MPTRSALFECQFFYPDEFIEELERDHAEDAVESNIVRLTLARRPVQQRAVRQAKDVFIEATYTTTNRNQLVRLSHYCGWIWTLKDEITPDPSEREFPNPTGETMAKANAAGTKVKSALMRLGVDIRAGGLFVEGYAESPIDHTREPFADEVFCAGCAEPIYYANESWRHTADKRADRTQKVPCSRCDGSGLIRIGHAATRCSCLNGIREVFDHSAEPATAKVGAA